MTNDLLGTFRRFVALPPVADVALALWTLHAHAHEAFDVSPVLGLTSPEKRCGKTTTLRVLGALVPRPLLASSVSTAALFRTIERYKPTFLVDEADSFLRDNEELRGALNSGHHRALATFVRTVGEDFESRAFSTWCPKAIALIGRLAATLEDRAILIPMRRRAPGEPVERMRLDRLGKLGPLCRRGWRWTQDRLDDLRGADPVVPEQLDDRAADN